MGAALLQANSVALVTTAAPPGRLRAALGCRPRPRPSAWPLGPTVGGVIVATLGWRWVYAINVPVGAVAIGAAVLFLPRTDTASQGGPSQIPPVPLSVGGAVSGLAAGPLRPRRPGPPGLGGLAALIAAAGACWLALARRLAVRPRRSPVPRPSGSRSGRGFRHQLFGYLVLFGPLVLVPSVLIQAGYSSLQAGVILSALAAGFAVSATTSGWCLPKRWDDRRRCWLGGVVAAASVGTLLGAPFHPSSLVAILAVLGLGLGILAPANNAAIMRAVPAEASATAGGLLNMTRGLGTALGICAVTVCAELGGPRLAVAALVAAAVLCLMCLHLSRDSGRNMPGHENRRRASPGISRCSAPRPTPSSAVVPAQRTATHRALAADLRERLRTHGGGRPRARSRDGTPSPGQAPPPPPGRPPARSRAHRSSSCRRWPPSGCTTTSARRRASSPAWAGWRAGAA